MAAHLSRRLVLRIAAGGSGYPKRSQRPDGPARSARIGADTQLHAHADWPGRDWLQWDGGPGWVFSLCQWAATHQWAFRDCPCLRLCETHGD